MKKIFFIFAVSMCFLPFLIKTSFSNPVIKVTAIKDIYEAEEAVLLDNILMLKDPSASGGKYLRMTKRGSVQFKVTVQDSGRYGLFIAYRSPHGDNAQRILFNGREYAPEIGFPISGQWTEIETKAGLSAGENTIELRKSWGNMDIDYLIVEGPVFDPPEITPQRNTFYRTSSSLDLYIQLEKNHNRFKGLTHQNKTIPYEIKDVNYVEDAVMIKIPNTFLRSLEPGDTELYFHFNLIKPIKFDLAIRDRVEETELTIVSLDVRHGTAVLFLLPTGKSLLVDTGTEVMCKERVIPFLDTHDIKLNHLWITHYHDDHAGGKDLLTEKFRNMIIKDYKDFKTDTNFEFEKTGITILNAYSDGTILSGENSRSLSFRMEYRNFVYTHGGDIYGQNQQDILQRYNNKNPDLLKTHVYHANHHFHGSVDVDYLKFIDPYLFLVSGEEHVYGRGAYTVIVKQKVIDVLKEEKKRFIEDLLAFEVGHMVVRVTDGDHWHYETYKNLHGVIPFLKSYK